LRTKTPRACPTTSASTIVNSQRRTVLRRTAQPSAASKPVPLPARASAAVFPAHQRRPAGEHDPPLMSSSFAPIQDRHSDYSFQILLFIPYTSALSVSVLEARLAPGRAFGACCTTASRDNRPAGTQHKQPFPFPRTSLVSGCRVTVADAAVSTRTSY